MPYKVVIERDSREILEIRRNYDEADKLCQEKQVFVQYIYIPGIGFYGLGLVNVMGNTTMAATAGWREGLDAGMFANFPGFLYAKTAGRQNTLEFRVAPGSGVPVDTGGMPINQAVMPLPYKEMGPGMMQLISDIVQTGKQIGGTAEIEVGEGNQEAPVGTTIALIEQATKPQSAVHKRIHAAQALEFQLLINLIREDPESFIAALRKPTQSWDPATLVAALNNYDLVPAADPNTSSSAERLGRAQAVYQIAKDNPNKFNQDAVYEYVLTAMNAPASRLLAQQDPNAQPQPDPMMLQAQAMVVEAEAKKMQVEQQGAAAEKDRTLKAAEIDAKLKIAETDLEIKRIEKAISLHKVNTDAEIKLIGMGYENESQRRELMLQMQEGKTEDGMAKHLSNPRTPVRRPSSSRWRQLRQRSARHPA